MRLGSERKPNGRLGNCRLLIGKKVLLPVGGGSSGLLDVRKKGLGRLEGLRPVRDGQQKAIRGG